MFFDKKIMSSYKFDLVDPLTGKSLVRGAIAGQDRSFGYQLTEYIENGVRKLEGLVEINLMDSTKVTNNEKDTFFIDSNGSSKDTIKISGSSMFDFNNWGIFSKDSIQVVLGNNDTLVIENFQATKQTTNFDVILSRGVQILDFKNLAITPWNTGTSGFINIDDLAVINLSNLESQDKVLVNSDKQKLRFSQEFNDVTVDIVKKFGFFERSQDYLGRLNFQDTKLDTVLKSFNLTPNVSLKGDVVATIWQNKSTPQRKYQFDQEIIVELQDDFSLRDYLDGENDQFVFNGFDSVKSGIYFGQSTIKSINDKDPLTGMSQKDFFKFNLKNDTLFVNSIWANKTTTNLHVNLFEKGASKETLNLANLDITPWYLTGKFLTKNDILVINVKNLSREDKVFFDSKSQDLKFYQKGSSAFVDIVEEGGSFQNPDDYLGRLRFLETNIMTVQNAFQSI